MAEHLLSVLRIAAAFLFIQFGTAKLFAIPGSIVPGGGTVSLPSLIGFGAVLEVVGGALLLLGFHARIAAFVLSGEMAVAYFMSHAPQGFWPVINQGTLAALFSFVWLFISAAGPGPWSIDAMAQRREMTSEARHISVSINRNAADVYRFISAGENLLRWATGLGEQFTRANDEWLVQGPLGRVRVRIAAPNDFGVADQDVTLENGVTVHNPIRVVPNGSGSTVTFTLIRLPGVSAQKFEADARWVEKDLLTLKAILERP